MMRPAALVKDGEISERDTEEERLSREKHSSKFPLQAIRKILEMEGISIHEVDKFTYFYDPWLEVTSNIAYFSRYFPGRTESVLSSFGLPMASRFFRA